MRYILRWTTLLGLLVTLGTLATGCGQPPQILQCTGLADCVGETACIQGTCKAVYGRTYNLTFVSATIPEKQKDGNLWDTIGGLPDPYCTLQASPGTNGQTNVEEDTLKPEWKDSVSLTLLAGQILNFNCYDQDLNGNQLMFSKGYKVTPEDVRSGSFSLSDSAGFSLRLQLKPTPTTD
ncbi:MAG: hypothetical protein EP343_03220 [Deltaproteobacteria bacterium]|nr:MAG: hypothetical protein EP343_03220 [Deltaproteobacteria bacterium]